jgi:hypothetical protein
MTEVVINYDKENNQYKVYEPSTDTILITTNLGDTFIKLSEFLKNNGLISSDILNTQDITYHLDSATFLAIIESNVKLLKRLNDSPSGFMISSRKFNGNFGNTSLQGGRSNSAFQKEKNNQGQQRKKISSSLRTSNRFNKSSFNNSAAKFGRF